MRESTAVVFIFSIGCMAVTASGPAFGQLRSFGAPVPIHAERVIPLPPSGERETRSVAVAPSLPAAHATAMPQTHPPAVEYRFDFEKNRFVPASEMKRPTAAPPPRRWPRRDTTTNSAPRDTRRGAREDKGVSSKNEAAATEAPRLVFASAPELVALPGSWIYAVPEHDGEVFFVEGLWWRRHEDRWYRSHYHDRDWRSFDGTPYFAREIPENWKTLVLASRWRNREWQFERISHLDVQRNWLSWKSERHWDWNPEVRTASEELKQRRVAMSQVPLFDGSAEAVGGPVRGPR
jgi:hypothetical protein